MTAIYNGKNGIVTKLSDDDKKNKLVAYYQNGEKSVELDRNRYNGTGKIMKSAEIKVKGNKK